MNAALATSTSPQAPATGAAQEAITPQPMAIVTTVIAPDQITTTVQLLMGGHYMVQRTWTRTGKGSWTSREGDFIDAEERIGVELAEYADQMELPIRVANMLPYLPAKPHSARERAASVVEGLRHE